MQGQTDHWLARSSSLCRRGRALESGVGHTAVTLRQRPVPGPPLAPYGSPTLQHNPLPTPTPSVYEAIEEYKLELQQPDERIGLLRSAALIARHRYPLLVGACGGGGGRLLGRRSCRDGTAVPRTRLHTWLLHHPLEYTLRPAGSPAYSCACWACRAWV